MNKFVNPEHTESNLRDYYKESQEDKKNFYSNLSESIGVVRINENKYDIFSHYVKPVEDGVYLRFFKGDLSFSYSKFEKGGWYLASVDYVTALNETDEDNYYAYSIVWAALEGAAIVETPNASVVIPRICEETSALLQDKSSMLGLLSTSYRDSVTEKLDSSEYLDSVQPRTTFSGLIGKVIVINTFEEFNEFWKIVAKGGIDRQVFKINTPTWFYKPVYAMICHNKTIGRLSIKIPSESQIKNLERASIVVQ